MREFSGHRDILDAELLAGRQTAGDLRLRPHDHSGWNAEDRRAGPRPSKGTTERLPTSRSIPTGKSWRACSSVARLQAVPSRDRGAARHALEGGLSEQYTIAFTRDGSHVVAAGADNRIRVWKLLSLERPEINPLVHSRFAHECPIAQLAFTPDGRQLVTVAEDRTVKLWKRRPTPSATRRSNPRSPRPWRSPERGSFTIGRMDGTVETFSIDPLQPSRARQKRFPLRSRPLRPGPRSPDERGRGAGTRLNALAEATRIALPATVTAKIRGGRGEARRRRLPVHGQGRRRVVIEGERRPQQVSARFVQVGDSHSRRRTNSAGAAFQAIRDSYFQLPRQGRQPERRFRASSAGRRLKLNE